MWITNSLQADWMLACWPTPATARRTANKTLIVRADGCAAGHHAGSRWPKIRKIGMIQQRHRRSIHFDDVRVPQRYRIGEEGQGFVYQMQQFQEERLCGGGQLPRLAWSSASPRPSSGRSSARLFGSHRWPTSSGCSSSLAELKTEVEALRALTYRACDLYVHGQDVTELASMAKLLGGRLNRSIPTAACSSGAAWAHTGQPGVAALPRRARWPPSAAAPTR
jgi:citronellyl-CoA dehydrogenase